MNLSELGSKTAKAGFQNEKNVRDRFNNWKTEKTARKWLELMGYKIPDIEYVEAIKIKRSFKTDVQVQVRIKLKKAKKEGK